MPPVSETLARHFGGLPLTDLITASRAFPITSQVDLQQAVSQTFAARYQARLVGVHAQYNHETLTIPRLLEQDAVVGPLRYEEIDVGDLVPVRCLTQGLWMAVHDEAGFAVLLSPGHRYGHINGIHLEIAVAPGESGLALSRAFLEAIEKSVLSAGSYRGKVLSLEASRSFSGDAGAVKVHKLRAVCRDEVILPARTLELLERNVHGFIAQRERLRELGLPVKKGLLFYGPPGTGKTHTIHYLASQLGGHTTLLITAEQVGLIDEYFKLARFLQPSMVVIEDVDLIARAREQMRGACEESLLNRLLNEMDGLREDAAVLFVLTTNRPEQLEAALASRPGRIDQAVEFPLPDAEGRRKLVTLYARGVSLPPDVVDLIVQKTDRASAAFIKELMRRAAQYLLQSGRDGAIRAEHIEASLDEMLFSGGTLNVKLLGGAASP